MTSKLAVVRTRWAAVGAAVAVTIGAVGVGGLNIANADVSSGDRPVFIPINPCRLIDTRPDTPVGDGETRSVTAHGSNGECTGTSAIPADAVALALNVTAVGASDATFLTFWGDGANPGTSNLNPRPGAAPTPNSVNTPLSATGTFNMYNDAGDVDVIADVNGYYAHHDHDDRYPLIDDVHPKADVYTRTEADARFATPAQIDDAARVDQLVLGGLDFSATPGATEWEFTFLWAKDPGADECIQAGFEAEAGRSFSSVAIRHANVDPADVTVSVIGTIGTAGPVAEFSDLIHLATPAPGGQNIPGSPDEQITETIVPLDVDLLVREDYHYSMVICTPDEFSIASGIIEFD